MPKVVTDTGLSSITGRNGTYTMTELEFYLPPQSNLVRIAGYGQRKEEIHGGMFVNKEALVKLCRTFLEENGYEVNLITMSRRLA